MAAEVVKLSAGEEARRNYTIYGKTNLTDKAWHSPTKEASRFLTAKTHFAPMN